MIDDYETCLSYREKLFDRQGHAFRLMACADMTSARCWISELQIKSPVEAHLHAVDLMTSITHPYQVWILDETTGDVILPLLDIRDRYNAIQAKRMRLAHDEVGL